MHLSGLFLYPVKSLRGCQVNAARVDALGLEHDRRFLIVDPAGKFLTQRTLPRMALIATAVSATQLTLAVPGGGTLQVPCEPTAAPVQRTVSVWKSEGLSADDCGDDAAAWLSDFLATPCRLVRIGRQFRRPLLKPLPGPAADHCVTFADAFPFLVVGEASLHDLNDRLVARGDAPVPMDRFRPNLVVAGGAPFAEDAWTRFHIGSVRFRTGGPCARCIVTTTDQQTGERGPEPLRTLATYRRDPRDSTNVNFGQNLVHETKTGLLRVGDRVETTD